MKLQTSTSDARLGKEQKNGKMLARGLQEVPLATAWRQTRFVNDEILHSKLPTGR